MLKRHQDLQRRNQLLSEGEKHKSQVIRRLDFSNMNTLSHTNMTSQDSQLVWVQALASPRPSQNSVRFHILPVQKILLCARRQKFPTRKTYVSEESSRNFTNLSSCWKTYNLKDHIENRDIVLRWPSVEGIISIVTMSFSNSWLSNNLCLHLQQMKII